MRPASPRAVALWITVLSLLAALFSLSGLALAQAAAGPKRKASQQSAQQGPIAGSRAAARKARSKATTDTWTGGGGSGNTDWSDASNWNNGAIVSGENIAINATTAATVDDQAFTIGTLTLGNSGDSVTLNNNVLTTVEGNISNAGTITFDAAGNNTGLYINNSLTLSGNGTINLTSTNGQYTGLLYGAAGSVLTTSSNIVGAGTVGNGDLNFINSGTINANANGLTLLVNPDACVTCTNTNTGTLEATGGGILVLSNGTWTNAGGKISAAANSSVDLESNVSITGGTLTTSGSGVIYGESGSDVFLTNVTNTGNYTLQNNNATEISGTLVNSGTITLDGAGNATQLYLTGNTTLSGTGTVVLTSTNNQYTGQFDGVSGSVLTNQTTIEGWGTIGDGVLEIANASNGVINSNVSGGSILVNPLTSVTSTNAGLIEATNGGTLTLSNGTWTNTGTILAATGSSVFLNSNVSITGGTLESTGTGVVYNQAGSDVFLTGLTLAGTYDLQNNAATEINGTITNNGVINLQSSGNLTELYVTTAGTGTATLAGSGSIVLGTGSNNALNGASGTSLIIDQNVSGVGNIGEGNLTLTNNSTIDANISPTVANAPLYIQAGAGGLVNNGKLEATNGGTLTLYDGAINNTGGTIEALGADSSNNASTVVLTVNTSITGGTLTTTGAGVIEVASGNTANLINLTNGGTLNVLNNAQIDSTGTITNNGTITLEAAGNATYFYAPNTTTLAGTGTLVMGSTNGQYTAYVQGAGGMTLTNDETITGAGFIQEGTFVNNGTINANVSGQSLVVQDFTAATNTKTMEASNGGTLVFEGSSWNNTGGSITAETGSTVELTANTTITGGTLGSVGTGQVYVASGNTANLSGLTLSGTINVQNNAQIDTTGTITNNGTITLEAAGNATYFYAPNTTTLTGTGTLVLGSTNNQYTGIIQGAGAQVLTNDETITGAGTIQEGTFVNNGTINANVSGQTLLLQDFTGATNTKTMEATNGGTMEFSGSNWTNTGGTISAQNGSAVELANSVSITGGTLTTSGTGQIYVASGDIVYLTGLTNSGTINVQNNAQLELAGAMTNSGTINLLGDGNATYLLIDGSVTLNGTGIINLGGTSLTNNIYGEGTSPILISHNTIEGAGNIGSGTMGFTNDGTLDANIAGQSLAINVDSSGFTNYNGTTTTLTGGTYIANAGNITFAAGNATGITTLSASVTEENGGQIINTTNGANALAGLTSITSTGALTIGGVAFTDTGSFSNAGSLTILKGESFSVGSLTQISGGALTAGTYVLDANLNLSGATENITSNRANLTLAGGTIENANGTSALAHLASNSGKLTLANDAKFVTTAASFNNTGTLTIGNKSSFTANALTQITGTGADQTLSGGTFVLAGDLDIKTGTANITTNASNLTLEGTGTIENTSNSSNALANLATNSLSLTLADDANFTTTGSFTNNGTLAINSGSTFTVLTGNSLSNFSGNTLTGGTYVVGGTLAFNAGTTGAIETDAANITMEGSGAIENTSSGAASTNALVNLNTISSTGSFTLASNANFTAAGNFTNSGALTVDSGSTFTLTGTNVLTNLASGTLTGGTYTVGGTLQLTSANGGITTNAANLTLTGTKAAILDGTANALAGFNNNSGSLTLSGDAALTTASSNFTNTGTVDVASGSTLTVGGTNHSYSQTGGQTTIDGTLAILGSGSASITGGTILGAGTVKGNLSVGNATGTAATVNVGDSGKAGLLSITGKYTQLATGNMTGLINGTTAGSGFSQMKVTGTAALAGTINFTVATAFQASLSLGEKFTVLTAGSVTGTFSNSTIAINSTYQFDVSYTSTGVVLTVAAATPNGQAAQGAAQVATVSIRRSSAFSRIVDPAFRRSLRGIGRIARPVKLPGWAQPTEHSNVRLAGGYENDLRRWEHLPMIPASRVGTGIVARTPLAWDGSSTHGSLPTSDLRMANHVIGVQSPVAGWTSTGSNRRVPVKILAPTLPRLVR
jgi:fibronectin-binding autotransporter adhesin